ncbi:MAG TPA: DMT family protein [Pyrinomonadaceae bacterium]|nr:DMT family protein [Pyrinomonadaceae bacterium]
MFKTIVLLVISNIFMTLAWYGHLKYKTKPLIVVIVVSWLIAFFEYIFQVPANRIGSQIFTVTQLKILQECITLVVFTGIAYLLFGETLKWNILVSYVLIIGAVYFSFAF